MLSESKYLADFLEGFLCKKPQTTSIPIHIVLPYYMISFIYFNTKISTSVQAICVLGVKKKPHSIHKVVWAQDYLKS